MKVKMNIQEFKHKKTIIVGEVNTGKTGYLEQIIKKFFEEGEKGLALIDMAPELTRGIGGKMSIENVNLIRYFTAAIVPPRLIGRSDDEVEELAELNAALIEAMFVRYLKSPAEALFLNDISLYLQAGDLQKLLLWLNSTPTVVMNGYYGTSLGGGRLGQRERQNMAALQKRCDKIIELQKSSTNAAALNRPHAKEY